MEPKDSEYLSTWLNDPSFIHWAKRIKGRNFDHWEKWFIQHPEQREIAEVARQMTQGLPFRPLASGIDDQQKLEELWDHIRISESNKDLVSAQRKYFLPYPYRLVATIILLLIFGITCYVIRYEWAESVIRTGYEETRIEVLKDGSRVVLNANSTLTYNYFTPRKVRLDGEAYFEIEKKPLTNEKFQVLTKDLTVEVLGTEFNVKHRQRKTEVFLKEGKVRLNLENKDSILTMHPGDYIAYSSLNAQHYVIHESPQLSPASWKDGVTLLESVPLHQVLEEIKSIYGIDITLQNESLKNHVLTVALPVEDMNIGLQTLEHALNLKVKKIEEKVYLLHAED